MCGVAPGDSIPAQPPAGPLSSSLSPQSIALNAQRFPASSYPLLRLERMESGMCVCVCWEGAGGGVERVGNLFTISQLSILVS